MSETKKEFSARMQRKFERMSEDNTHLTNQLAETRSMLAVATDQANSWRLKHDNLVAERDNLREQVHGKPTTTTQNAADIYFQLCEEYPQARNYGGIVQFFEYLYGLMNTSLGVGDGTGDLFVYGKYEAVKKVQTLILNHDQLKANFDELAALVGWTPARCEQTGDSPMDCARELQLRMINLPDVPFNSNIPVPPGKTNETIANGCDHLFESSVDMQNRGMWIVHCRKCGYQPDPRDVS